MGLDTSFFRRLRPDIARPVQLSHTRSPSSTGLRPGLLLAADGEQGVKRQALREAFTPHRPQRNFRSIGGRMTQLLRIFEAIAQEGAHVVVYGERGHGKTSLVNLVAAAASSSGCMVGRCTCAVDSDFDEIMRSLARDLPPSFLAVPVVEDETLEGCEAALPRTRLQPRDIAAFPGRLTGRKLLLIIDEFDRVADCSTRTCFADTIKQVSDWGAAVNFIIVGVSDSLNELLGQHPSIQRNVVGVPIPLLSDADIHEILHLGSRKAQMEFPPHIGARIVKLARGVPYIAQLLGLHAGENALARDTRGVDQADLQAAMAKIAVEVDPRMIAVYEELTQGGQDTAMRNLLYLMATCTQSRFARFPVLNENGEVHVAGNPVQPSYWNKLVEAKVIRTCPSAGLGVCTFSEPLLPHYILLRIELDRLAQEKSAERSGVFA